MTSRAANSDQAPRSQVKLSPAIAEALDAYCRDGKVSRTPRVVVELALRQFFADTENARELRAALRARADRR